MIELDDAAERLGSGFFDSCSVSFFFILAVEKMQESHN